MDDLKILYYEMLAATKRCSEDGYTLASIDNALACVANYYRALPAGGQKASVGELLISLRKKKTMTIENGLTDHPQTVSRKDLDALCPLTPARDLERPVLSVSYVIDNEVSRMYRDNAMILCGAFEDELVYESKNFAGSCGMDYRFVDLEAFIKSGSLSKVLQLLQAYYRTGEQKDVIAYKGLECLADHDEEAKAFARMLRQMRLKARKCTQLLLSTDPQYYFNDLYASLFDAPAVKANILEDDYSIKPLTFMYMPLPTYANSSRTFLTHFHIPAETEPGGDGETPAPKDNSETEAYIKANCLPLACGMLMQILGQSSSVADFKDKSEPVVSKRKRMLNAFISKAGDSALSAIIDADWGYAKPARKKGQRAGSPVPVKYKYTVPVTQYDYDCMDDISAIRKGVQFVLDEEFDGDGNPLTIRQKCGLVLRYALTNGDAMNLVNISMGNENEMKARWTVGYAALTQLLRVPNGNLVFDIKDSEGLDGQCCDNGKTIRFHPKFLRDSSTAAEGCDTMLHELFHAMQYESRVAVWNKNKSGGSEKDRDLLDYYKYNFGITDSRIEAWEDNQKRGYIVYNKNMDGYHVQVYEADARVFAADTWAASEDVTLRSMD